MKMKALLQLRKTNEVDLLLILKFELQKCSSAKVLAVIEVLVVVVDDDVVGLIML